MLKKALFLFMIAMMAAAVVGCTAKLPRRSIENVGSEPRTTAEPVAEPTPQPEPQPVIDEDPMEVPAANADEAPTPDIGGEDLAEETLPEEAPAPAAEQTPETMVAQAEPEAAQPAQETAEKVAAQPEDTGIATTPDELPAPEPVLEAPATAAPKSVTEPEVVEATKPEAPVVAQPETVEAVKPQAEPEPMVDPEKEDLSDIYETPAVTPSTTTDAPAASAVGAPATVDGPGYYIQVGAFGDTVNATRALNKLKDEGFAGSRLVTRDSGLVAVQAGVFPDEATAEEALSTITDLYPGSKVVKGE